jgi:hypothetical protein
MTFPRDAWILRRLLADLPLNGELDTMTGALKSMAGHLAGLGRGSGRKRDTGGSGTAGGSGTEREEAGQVRGRKRDRSDIAKSGDFSACPHCQ